MLRLVRRTVRRKTGVEVVFGGVVFLVLLVALAGLVLLVMALVDLAGRPAEVWARSGQNQLVWALIVLLVGFVGPLLYLLIARPALETATEAGAFEDRA